MIYKIIKPIDDIIKELPYVGRYGGIVNTATRPVEVGIDGHGNPIYAEERVPVASGVSAVDCWSNGRYSDLCPNDNYPSIFYLEQMDGMRYLGLADKIAQQTFHKFSERLRLVGWLNMPKLGVEESNGHSSIAFSLFKNLTREWKAITDPLNIFRLEVRLVNFEPKHLNPFTKYTYEDVSAMWLYPYDYISAIIEVTVTLNENCIDEFEPGEDISCYIDNSIPDPPEVGTNFAYQEYEQRWPYFRALGGKKMYWRTWVLGPGIDGHVLLSDFLQDDIEDIVWQQFRAKNSDADPLWDHINRFVEPDPDTLGFKVFTNSWQQRNEITLAYTKKN